MNFQKIEILYTHLIKVYIYSDVMNEASLSEYYLMADKEVHNKEILGLLITSYD